MGRRKATRRPLPPATHLVLMASTASAMSLSNFQLITSSTVPLGCILAYNQNLQGCTMADFTQGPQGEVCSQSCQAGIISTQNTLKAVCIDATAPSNSVLGAALTGNLVQLLCGNGNGNGNGNGADDDTSTISRSTTAAVVVVPTPSPPQPPQAPDPPPAVFTTIPDVPPPQLPTPDAPSPVITTPFSPPQQTSSPPPNQDDPGRGGGSPFDAQVVNAAPAFTVRWSQSLLLAVSVGFLLLR